MDHWPFRNLVLRTPRLELRPDDDEGLAELADVTLDGIHAPDRMPFAVEWTDASREQLGIMTFQHYWGERAALSRERWRLNFLVRVDGRVIGMQGLYGENFPILREVGTGSWVGLRHQGQGIGTEMRAAVLAFAFDHLGAVAARSSAFNDNAASHGVSRKLGYRPDGTFTQVRRGEPAEQTRLLLTPATFRRPDWTVEVNGVIPCLPLLTGREPTE